MPLVSFDQVAFFLPKRPYKLLSHRTEITEMNLKICIFTVLTNHPNQL